MRKIILVFSICFSSLCLADFDTVVVLNGDDERVNGNKLIEGSDGSLYGTNQHKGEFGFGSIYKVNKDGSGYQVLHSFAKDPNDGINPRSNVIEGSDGILYGTTMQGGRNTLGTVFKINKDGSNYAIVHTFSKEDIGTAPEQALLEASDGALYGSTTQCGEGYTPEILSNGNLQPCNSSVRGPTIFKINKDGTGFTNLFFMWNVDTDPTQDFGFGLVGSALIEGSDGYLYGNASSLFRISKDGSDLNFIVDSTKEGSEQRIIGIELTNNNGVLYATSPAGGLNNFGFVFKINEDGSNFTTLRRFANQSDFPNTPRSGVALDRTIGVLYGVANNIAYKLNIDGSGFERVTERILGSANTTPVLASDGALYGTMAFHAHCGVDLIPGIYSLRDSVKTIFDWAEAQLPQYFPTKEITQFSDPWAFRHYPATNIYLGINNNDDGVYVLGGVFGGTPLFVGSKKVILTQAIGINAILCEN